MEIVVDNVYSHFIDFYSYPEELKSKLSRAASYFVQGANFSLKYKNGTWDGRWHLLDKNGRVPTGLVGMLLDIIKESGYQIHITNNIEYPLAREWKYTGHELRDYQQEASEAFLRAHRGIIELPTRSGKTVVAAKVIAELGQRCVYLVNGKESMYQTYNDIRWGIQGPTFGFYGDGKKNIDADVTIGLIQSFSRMTAKTRNNVFNDVGLIILDEVHKAAADSIYKFFMGIKAPYRMGMSGTAFRIDNQDLKLMAVTGRHVYVKKQIEMWNEGHIEQPTVYWVDVHTDTLHRAMDYRAHYRRGIICNDFRNNLIKRLLDKHSSEQVLISVENIEHGEILAALLKDKGVSFASGANNAEAKRNRERIFHDFQTGKVKHVIATRIFNESLTFPDLAVLINAAGRKSALELIQKFGRVQGKGNKNKVMIYDFNDQHSYYLEKHAKERRRELKKRDYKQERFSDVLA